jgi:hypothetical protein
VNGPDIWPRLRHRPPRLGKHRALPTVSESDMPPVRPASLPLPDLRASVPAPVPPEPDPEPGKIVECGFCHVTGLSSQMADIGGGQYRCDLRVPAPDGFGCVERNIRWRETGAKAAPLVSSAEPLEDLPETPGMAAALAPLRAQLHEPAPVLPPAQEEALENFQAAHDAQDAAEGKDLSEDDEPATDAGAEAAEPSDEAAPVAAEPEPQDGGEGE